MKMNYKKTITTLTLGMSLFSVAASAQTYSEKTLIQCDIKETYHNKLVVTLTSKGEYIVKTDFEKDRSEEFRTRDALVFIDKPNVEGSVEIYNWDIFNKVALATLRIDITANENASGPGKYVTPSPYGPSEITILDLENCQGTFERNL